MAGTCLDRNCWRTKSFSRQVVAKEESHQGEIKVKRSIKTREEKIQDEDS